MTFIDGCHGGLAVHGFRCHEEAVEEGANPLLGDLHHTIHGYVMHDMLDDTHGMAQHNTAQHCKAHNSTNTAQ
jgi:hypothetical protein